VLLSKLYNASTKVVSLDLKKRIVAFILILALAVAYVPTRSQAVITPHFVIINETLLPFNEETMPFIIGADVFIPVGVLSALRVWEVGAVDHVRLYGGGRYIDFYTAPGNARTVARNGVELNWPPARVVGARFYVPLRQVASFFGFSSSIHDIPEDIIPERQMRAVRIVSDSVINAPTAIGMNRAAIRESYLQRFPPPPPEPPVPQPPDPPQPPITEEPPQEVLPPDYSDVTIHLSFFDISAGSAPWILDLLDIRDDPGFYAIFFVSAEDIRFDPGLMRRISGSGHSLGIWLNEGTFEEYLYISALLFDAAKTRTVIVTAYDEAQAAREMAYEHGLIFWESGPSMVDYIDQTMAEITQILPRESGDRANLMFSCTGDAAEILPGIYSYLRTNLFTVVRITETVEPTAGEEEELLPES